MYQASLGPEKVRLTRIVTVLAGALNLAFMLLDYWALTSAINAAWSIRFALIGLCAMAFASTWHPAFLRLYDAVVAVLFLALGFGVNGMVQLATDTDVARDHYYGGLLLITYGLYGLTYVPLRISLSISCAFTGSYLLTASNFPATVLATNLYFFVATTLVGIVALSVRERYSEESFLLRHSLQEDVLRKHEEAQRAAHLAEHDALTGLPNRTRFFKDAGELLQQAQAMANPAAVLFIDLNGFKPINDRYGHAVGDRVLAVIASRLRECLRTEDVVARLGGDEFVACIAVADATPASIAAVVRHLAKRIRDGIDSRDGQLHISASVGVALYPEDGSDLRTLLRRADQDMYRIKSQQRISSSPAWPDYSTQV